MIVFVKYTKYVVQHKNHSVTYYKTMYICKTKQTNKPIAINGVRCQIIDNGGNKKRSGLEAESLSTAKNFQKVIPFQITPNQLCFLLRVIASVFINLKIKIL